MAEYEFDVQKEARENQGTRPELRPPASTFPQTTQGQPAEWKTLWFQEMSHTLSHFRIAVRSTSEHRIAVQSLVLKAVLGKECSEQKKKSDIQNNIASPYSEHRDTHRVGRMALAPAPMAHVYATGPRTQQGTQLGDPRHPDMEPGSIPKLARRPGTSYMHSRVANKSGRTERTDSASDWADGIHKFMDIFETDRANWIDIGTKSSANSQSG